MSKLYTEETLIQAMSDAAHDGRSGDMPPYDISSYEAFDGVVMPERLTAENGAKDKQFHKELKILLKKFNAEIMIEDFGSGFGTEDKIVVDFSRSAGEAEVPQLVLGTYENGDD